MSMSMSTDHDNPFVPAFAVAIAAIFLAFLLSWVFA